MESNICPQFSPGSTKQFASKVCLIGKSEEYKFNLVQFPIPGIEPGPPGWEPGILTTRQYGMV